MAFLAVRFQEIGRDHGSNEARDGKAEQHCDDDGHAKLNEELTRHTRHQPNRQEDCNDRHRRRQHRQPDFVSGVDRGLIGGFAHAHVADDILDLDNRIIDQHTRH